MYGASQNGDMNQTHSASWMLCTSFNQIQSTVWKKGRSVTTFLSTKPRPKSPVAHITGLKKRDQSPGERSSWWPESRGPYNHPEFSNQMFHLSRCVPIRLSDQKERNNIILNSLPVKEDDPGPFLNIFTHELNLLILWWMNLLRCGLGHDDAGVFRDMKLVVIPRKNEYFARFLRFLHLISCLWSIS